MNIKEKYNLIYNKEKAREVLSKITGLKDVRLINYFSRGVIPIKHKRVFEEFLDNFLKMEAKFNREIEVNFKIKL